MPKITFMGAGSSVFAKNVLGDCLMTDALRSDLDIALYDIDPERLSESFDMISALVAMRFLVLTSPSMPFRLAVMSRAR